MRRKDWHEDLLGGGILGVLKAWLEPVNGCLPLLEVCCTLSLPLQAFSEPINQAPSRCVWTLLSVKCSLYIFLAEQFLQS